MQANNLLNVLSSVIWVVPELLACFVGLAVCVTLMQRCRKAATLGLSGFIVMVLCILSGAATQMFVIGLSQSGRSTSEIGMLLTALGLVRAIGFAIGIVLLALAIPADRQRVDNVGAGKQ
jgi:hypothetical protein